MPRTSPLVRDAMLEEAAKTIERDAVNITAYVTASGDLIIELNNSPYTQLTLKVTD